MAIQTKPVTVPANAPYLQAPFTQEVVWALKAINAGQADAGQQSLAVRFIIWELTRAYDMSYRPDSTRDSDFAEGKRFVGNELIRALNMDPQKITRLPKMNAGSDDDDGSIQNM